MIGRRVTRAGYEGAVREIEQLEAEGARLSAERRELIDGESPFGNSALQNINNRIVLLDIQMERLRSLIEGATIVDIHEPTNATVDPA